MPTQLSLLFNAQPVEKVVRTNPSQLDIKEIYRTIQGEGPYVGQPAVFIRLAGCNLQCPLCDTDYTQGRKEMHVQEICNTTSELCTPNRLVVITGGEPFRQPIGLLVKHLLQEHYRVQIETNGTVYDADSTRMKDSHFNPYLSLVCSPKGRIEPTLKPHISALKYVMDARFVSEHDGLPTRTLGNNILPDRPWFSPNTKGTLLGRAIPIYLQPTYVEGDREATQRNIDACIKSCYKYGYTLSVQTHKVIGVA
jgi:7-carboxy-7-deazaguanine synthase